MNQSRFIYLKNTYTGTMPMVYHETGSPEKRTLKGIKNFLPPLVEYILSLPKKQIGCPDDLTIVTWNNYPEESILEQTCNHLGIPIQIYGKDIVNWTTNYEKKIQLMYDTCCKSTTKYILGVDSRDLVFLTSPQIILDEFKKLNIKMLFGGTIKTSSFYKGAEDLLHMFKTLPNAKRSLFRNLNGGQWIADREYAKKFFEKALTYPPRIENPSSDQIILAHTLCYNLDFQKETKIDYNCDIFQIYTNAFDLIFFYTKKSLYFSSIYEKIQARISYTRYILNRNDFIKRIKTSTKNKYKKIKQLKPIKVIRYYIKKL